MVSISMLLSFHMRNASVDFAKVCTFSTSSVSWASTPAPRTSAPPTRNMRGVGHGAGWVKMSWDMGKNKSILLGDENLGLGEFVFFWVRTESGQIAKIVGVEGHRYWSSRFHGFGKQKGAPNGWIRRERLTVELAVTARWRINQAKYVKSSETKIIDSANKVRVSETIMKN